MRQIADEATRGDVWVAGDLVDAIEHAARHTGLLEEPIPVLARTRTGDVFDEPSKFLVACPARRNGFEARVVFEVLEAKRGTEARPVARAGRTDGNVAVGGAHRLVGRRDTMRGTKRLWHLARGEVAA